MNPNNQNRLKSSDIIEVQYGAYSRLATAEVKNLKKIELLKQHIKDKDKNFREIAGEMWDYESELKAVKAENKRLREAMEKAISECGTSNCFDHKKNLKQAMEHNK
ncbi:hypothetical protein KAR91_04005 [Candidatus Pacearchaeota archaeon]|nr:hypothetical protein [Candidatus Pacearchaeota archaeon]